MGFWGGNEGEKGFLKKGSPPKRKFLEVRNLFLKKVPRREVFGKSENLFSKKGFRSKSKKGFLGESFFPKSEKFFP
ncbi:MAG: hypothetical protein D6805_04170 [Planctomycetota bacterium]|nr:MAG: hypothetical protein D6805_04170 [Planctomycetota bacterium]